MRNILFKINFRLIALAFLFSAASCSSSSKNDISADTALIKTVALEIEGMTCEMGCKNAIEKKVAKMEGVQSIQVDFQSATAEVTYDERITNPDEVIETIESIGGGLYSAKVALAQKN